MTDPDIVDIVTLLRSPDRLEPHTCNAAADEIEQLRKDWKVFALSAQLCIDRLTAERDEARVDACRLEAEARSRFARMSGMSCHYFSPKQIAKEREWDCFKENP